MRASTLFALTAAVLIGLVVALTAKMAGLFGTTTAPRAPTYPQVLVAGQNIFADTVISAGAVRMRNLRADEMPAYMNNKFAYLPPLPAAAANRIAKSNIEADTPITRDLLKDMAKPAPLNERLTPDMRAVNLNLSKERSAGGMIQPGDWVDVYLTSIVDEPNGRRNSRTAVLAPKVRVIAKRNTLWPIFAPLPKDKPIEYTLEVNQYRGELIEFARNKGSLSISPLPQAEQKKLEAARQEKLTASKNDDRPATAGMGAVESAPPDAEDEELQLAADVAKGEYVVTDQDLAHVFGIKPPESPPPPKPKITIERYVGTKLVTPVEFSLDGLRYDPRKDESNLLYNQGAVGGKRYPTSFDVHREGRLATSARGHQWGYGNGAMNVGSSGIPRFTAPDCPTCGKNKKGH